MLPGPTLPSIARADLAEARGALKAVFLKEFQPVAGACPNCNGFGAIWLQFVQSGPFSAPPPRGVLSYFNGWYVVDNRLYPCPVCQDHVALIRHLWERSGLESHERDWRLDFFQGLAGKEAAVAFAQDVLAALPRPTGWQVYFGGYGVGKSGLLKSLVAACVRAGVSAHYTLAEEILQRTRAVFGEHGGSEGEVLQAYGAYQLLAIDEIDRTSTSSWARATLMRLLDGRYNRRNLQATLLATNTPPNALPETLDYLASRLKDGARIEVGGKELRGGRAGA
jgi:hypothetical protein